jgi:hypothetical protein
MFSDSPRKSANNHGATWRPRLPTTGPMRAGIRLRACEMTPDLQSERLSDAPGDACKSFAAGAPPTDARALAFGQERAAGALLASARAHSRQPDHVEAVEPALNRRLTRPPRWVLLER